MAQANSIVAEMLVRLARSTTARRVALAAVLPFVGVVAAFGIAPDTVTEKITLQSVVEDVALAAPPSTAGTEGAYTRDERIRRGDTVASVLARFG